MISNLDKYKYLRILAQLKIKHANIFTQKEISKHLNVSVRKISDFQNGKVYDFWMLTQYAGLIGKTISFNLE